MFLELVNCKKNSNSNNSHHIHVEGGKLFENITQKLLKEYFCPSQDVFFIWIYLKDPVRTAEKSFPAFNQIGKGKNHLKFSQIKAFSQKSGSHQTKSLGRVNKVLKSLFSGNENASKSKGGYMKARIKIFRQLYVHTDALNEKNEFSNS